MTKYHNISLKKDCVLPDYGVISILLVRRTHTSLKVVTQKEIKYTINAKWRFIQTWEYIFSSTTLCTMTIKQLLKVMSTNNETQSWHKIWRGKCIPITQPLWRPTKYKYGMCFWKSQKMYFHNVTELITLLWNVSQC